MKPGVNIKFDNGNIEAVVPSADGVFGLLASSVAVGDTYVLNKPYLLKGMKDVADLGIIPDVANYQLYNWLEQFYQEAGEGTKLWLFGLAKDLSVSDWFTADKSTAIVPFVEMLNTAKGEISGVFTCFSPEGSYVPVIENAIDKDVVLAKQKAQIFAEEYTKSKASPFFVILEAYAFNGTHADLANLKEGNDNRVGLFIGNNQKRTGTPNYYGASTSTLAGRLAKIRVSKNAGEVKAGALELLEAYILDTPVENYDTGALYDKGYITYRDHERKAGYYIMDTPLATDPEVDDYRNIELRRTIDKAYRLAYDVASEEINTDFDVTNGGNISPFYAKTIEGKVESEIFTEMTLNKELSRDETNSNDLGVIAKFDTSANVATTSKISMTLKVRPRGYSRWFDLLLGFNVNLNK